MTKGEQMEGEARKPSQTKPCQTREWLDELTENELEFTREFEESIRRAEPDIAEGKGARLRPRTS
jgi:hypothetical protein